MTDTHYSKTESQLATHTTPGGFPLLTFPPFKSPWRENKQLSFLGGFQSIVRLRLFPGRKTNFDPVRGNRLCSRCGKAGKSSRPREPFIYLLFRGKYTWDCEGFDYFRSEGLSIGLMDLRTLKVTVGPFGGFTVTSFCSSRHLVRILFRVDGNRI